jgi:hypothetical protein
VIVLPFRPKLTPLEFENTTDCRLLLVVPALKFTAPPPPGAATEAVIIEPALVPNVTLFALEKFNVVKLKEPLDAEATGLTPPPPAAADNDNVSPLELLAVVPDRLVRTSVGFPWE